jgi:hypothetical protein
MSRWRAGLVIATLLAFVGPLDGAAAAYRSCAPVRNVFEGSRYEDSDLYRIRVQNASCKTARRVARRGTYKAVAAVPDRHGRVVVSYRAWTIVDDLRGSVDRFVARAAGRKRVRWLFGDI